MITAAFTGRVHRFLARVAPGEVPAFDAELTAALETSRGSYDDAEVRRVVLLWGGTAVMRDDPLTEDEMAALERARGGDFRGLHALESDGTWRTL
ncbi:MAG: DUF6247 family protein [Haloechinothrix sp.]